MQTPQVPARIAFVDPGPTCHPADVSRLEALVGHALPEDYRRYLLAHNGAQPTLIETPDAVCVVKVRWRADQAAKEGGSGRAVDSFLRLLAQRPGSPDLSETFWDFRARVPTGTLPIARGDGGTVFLLIVQGPGPGPVFYWDRDYWDPGYGTRSWPDRVEDGNNVGYVTGRSPGFWKLWNPNRANGHSGNGKMPRNDRSTRLCAVRV